jgi:uncharacterized protein YecE (DUF72 family)
MYEPAASKRYTLIYFNNHYGGKAVVNALEFKEMIGMSLSVKEKNVLEEAKSYLSNKQTTNSF